MSLLSSWLERKFDVKALREAVGHDFREFALLWAVFSILDMITRDKLSLFWVVANGAFSLVLWSLGAYIQMKKLGTEDSNGA